MDDKIKQIQCDIINVSYDAKACHIGSALSCVGILHDLFYTKKIQPEQFLFGKASGVLAYYIILADLGYFPKGKLVEYIKKYPLPSTEVPGIVHSFGSVGHALSIGAGMALGDTSQTYRVLLSDGDLMEGSTYEAALFIRQHHLNNLRVYVDNNGIVACGRTEDILNLTTAVDFFGKTIPHFSNVVTVKGDGVNFMEDNYHWHYKNLSLEERNNALCQIQG